MSRNGSGSYSLPAGNPVTTGTTISSTTHNNTLSDLATALTDSLAKDGQTTPTADLPMGTYKHTGVGDATARTQYAKVSQIQDGGYVTLASVSGADTITATCAPAITAYAAGQFFTFVSAGANTGAATLNINSLGAKAITKEGATALAAGEIASGAVVCVEYDGTQFQIVGGRSVQPLDADLTAIAALTTTAYGRALLELADLASTKTALEIPAATSFASSAENAAGTVESKAVDPLGIREAFNATGTAPVYACRAWVNFNGTGTVAIRSSGNVSSITDNGTGDYTVNFTTAMPDALYAAVVTSSQGGAAPAVTLLGQTGPNGNSNNYSAANITASALKFIVANYSLIASAVDPDVVHVAIFR